MKKRVRLEKKRTTSNKTVDFQMVSDDIGTRIDGFLRTLIVYVAECLADDCVTLDRKVKDWLYPFPDFISREPPYGSMKEIQKALPSRLDVELKDHPDDDLRTKLGVIFDRAIERWKIAKTLDGYEESFSWNNWAAIIVDVGQHRRDQPYIEWCDAEDLDKHLHQARLIENAKKRFQYAPIFEPRCTN